MRKDFDPFECEKEVNYVRQVLHEKVIGGGYRRVLEDVPMSEKITFSKYFTDGLAHYNELGGAGIESNQNLEWQVWHNKYGNRVFEDAIYANHQPQSDWPTGMFDGAVDGFDILQDFPGGFIDYNAVQTPMEGISKAHSDLNYPRSRFPMHREDYCAGSWSYYVWGTHRIWYFVPQSQMLNFQTIIAEENAAVGCRDGLSHKLRGDGVPSLLSLDMKYGKVCILSFRKFTKETKGNSFQMKIQ